MKACPFCAEEIQDAAIVCKHCGRDLPAATKPAPAPAIAPIKRLGPIARVFIGMGIVVGGVLLLIVGIIIVSSQASTSTSSSTAVADTPLDHRDWHSAGDGLEVRWFNDDLFSHVGGHCYARKADGSTRTSNGKHGLIDVGEKYCIRYGAKDTPFEVPDKR